MFRLRELEKIDIDTINSWRNDPDLILYLGAPFRYISIEIDQKWYESYLNNRNSCVRCSIVDDNDNILGLVSLTGINYTNRTCVYSIMIGNNECRGKGIGTYATNTMLNHAFNNMNMNRVELLVLESNERAIHMYEKCGFVYEGKKREAVYKNGRYCDMLIYSVIKSDWQNRGKI
jgi:UDP-4-amino-4,6-dideoxy-N-acetyl-beta-L-altrosamine N-acetyltransferase